MWKRASRVPAKPTSPTKYPSSTFVHTEKGYFYIVNDTKRFRIVSKRLLDSWSPHRVVETTEAALKNHKIAAKLKFRNGSLIWSLSDGRLFLIENGKRRHVVSPDALERIGAVWNDAIPVSLDEINIHDQGEDLG